MDIGGLIAGFGGTFWTLAAFVVALSVIVAVHEYGHYIVGRWTGIDAEVFSVGFGPVLFSRVDRRGTRWQVAALPFGGYVKFVGDANPASVGASETAMLHLAPEERRRTMHTAPLWARAATVSAGPIFNFVLSFLIFAAVIMAQGRPADLLAVDQIVPLPQAELGLEPGDRVLAIEGIEAGAGEGLAAYAEGLPSEPVLDWTVERDGAVLTVPGPQPFPPLIGAVQPRSAAAAADLRPGDVIVAAEGEPIAAFGALREAVEAAEGAAVTLEVWRSGETFEVTLAPRQVDVPLPEGGFEQRLLIGVTGDAAIVPATEFVGPLQALSLGVAQTAFVVQSSLSGMWSIVTGAISSCNISGPVGIAQASGQMASQGAQSFIWFIAVLSTAVGLLNLFPIPILDGGHLVFHAWEAVTGRAPSERALRVLMGAGLALLLTLMVFALTNDLFCP